MRIRLSVPYIFTFLLLVLVMLELHEMVHITVGRLICGDWGSRDFNVWSLCEGCQAHSSVAWLATLAGPLFSFMLMWLGMLWLYQADSKRRALGFSLVFANIPFGRISQAMMGGGDEMVVTRHLLKGSFTHPQMVLICSAVLLMAGLPPMIKAFTLLQNKWRWAYIAGFLTSPLAFILSYVLIALNGLLSRGFLASSWIMGTPLLITLHTLVAAILLTLTYQNLYRLNNER